MLKTTLVLALVALGLGACTVNRYYADPESGTYARQPRRADGPPGYAAPRPQSTYDDEYADDPGYDDGYAYDRPADPYVHGMAPAPRSRSCDCDCDCCRQQRPARHARRLAPPREIGPVRPVVPQNPADWLE